MFNRLLPRDDNFFNLFVRHAQEMENGSRALHALFSDMAHVNEHVRNVEEIEQRADGITHETADLLHRTFITPFDRDQILLLIVKMDDVLDLTEDVAQSIALYGVTRIRPEAKELEEVCLASVLKVGEMVGLLSNMKNASAILALSKEIKKLESDADDIMRTAVAKLFREEEDPRELIKTKEVYELLEMVTDSCDDVADIVQGVVLENA